MDRFVAYAVFLQKLATMQTHGLHLFMLINFIMPWPILWQRHVRAYNYMTNVFSWYNLSLLLTENGLCPTAEPCCGIVWESTNWYEPNSCQAAC